MSSFASPVVDYAPNKACSIASSNECGRYLVANKKFEAGEIVSKEPCICFVPTQRYFEVSCWYCAQICINEPIYAVDARSGARYCSTNCIALDKSIYSQESIVVSKLPIVPTSTELRLLIRAIVTKTTIRCASDPTFLCMTQ